MVVMGPVKASFDVSAQTRNVEPVQSRNEVDPWESMMESSLHHGKGVSMACEGNQRRHYPQSVKGLWMRGKSGHGPGRRTRFCEGAAGYGWQGRVDHGWHGWNRARGQDFHSWGRGFYGGKYGYRKQKNPSAWNDLGNDGVQWEQERDWRCERTNAVRFEQQQKF